MLVLARFHIYAYTDGYMRLVMYQHTLQQMTQKVHEAINRKMPLTTSLPIALHYFYEILYMVVRFFRYSLNQL